MAAPINVDWDAAESELAQQEKMLWNAEWELRVRCDKPQLRQKSSEIQGIGEMTSSVKLIPSSYLATLGL